MTWLILLYQLQKQFKKPNLNTESLQFLYQVQLQTVTTIEYEPGLRIDFPKMLSRIAPKDIHYEHDKTWHDANGHSHVRASLVGPSLTIPFKDNNLMLGTWQQIVLMEMDTRKREREIILQIIRE